jgi:guanylate kinase
MVKLGFKPIVSYTTRKPRHYEIEGKDYKFISFDDFQQRKADRFFAETTYYNHNHYGLAREDCQDDRCCVVEPYGLESLQEQYDNITVIFVKANEEVRRERLILRGDHPTEIIRRLTSDRDLFAGMEERCSFVFDNNEQNLDALPKHVEEFVNTYLRR